MKDRLLNVLRKIPIRIIKVSTLKRMSDARKIGNEVLSKLLADNHFLRTQMEGLLQMSPKEFAHQARKRELAKAPVWATEPK